MSMLHKVNIERRGRKDWMGGVLIYHEGNSGNFSTFDSVENHSIGKDATLRVGRMATGARLHSFSSRLMFFSPLSAEFVWRNEGITSPSAAVGQPPSLTSKDGLLGND